MDVPLARAYRLLTQAVDALADLLGWDRADAARRVTAAEHVCPRVGLDAAVLPPTLEATAAVFAAGGCSLRHVEVIARALASPAAGRLTPQVWAGAEAALAAQAGTYTPAELAGWARTLIDRLNQDGAAPDHAAPEPVNELFLTRNPHRAGGRIKARFDDAALFDAVATLIDAQAQPVDSHDHRPLGQRQAEALADACGYVLDHGDVPETGRPRNRWRPPPPQRRRPPRGPAEPGLGRLPGLRRAAHPRRAAPARLRRRGHPHRDERPKPTLDIGRATRTIPDGLRRAVLIRDHGCAYPGCPSTPSWTQIHHIRAWEDGGPTSLDDCCALCRVHIACCTTTPAGTSASPAGSPSSCPPPGSTPNEDPGANPHSTSPEPGEADAHARRPRDQPRRARSRSGSRRRRNWSGSHGHAGTYAVAGSFWIAATRARHPVSVSTMNGARFTRSFISERM